MSMSVVLVLASFVLSLAGLFIFIASMTRGLFGTAEEGSRVIFAPDEENTTEDPAASRANQVRLQAQITRDVGSAPVELDASDVAARIKADRSSALPVFLCFSLAYLG
jgi:cytochrome c oxidase cbb3-type subunit 1